MGRVPTERLARRLFTYSSGTSAVRLLLLSATPYRMYTLHHESDEDDHYQDFLRTVEFLDPELEESGDLRGLLDDYRQAMYRIEVRNRAGGTDQGEDRDAAPAGHVADRAAAGCRRHRTGCCAKSHAPGVELTANDVQDFLALAKIGREVNQPRVLDYWKSAPYLLSFMDDYQLKKRVVAGLDKSSEERPRETP